jgi:hypothetical protein
LSRIDHTHTVAASGGDLSAQLWSSSLRDPSKGHIAAPAGAAATAPAGAGGPQTATVDLRRAMTETLPNTSNEVVS